MSNQEVLAQQNSESTAGESPKVALKYVKIPTTEDVQLAALLACERLGNTLPVCGATRTKVKEETRLERAPVMLSFGKALIKQGGGEGITQLSSSVAGLNFIALAAALVTTTGLGEASSTVQHMIELADINKELVPDEHHTHNVLEALEPRLNRMGFLERCYVWDRWLLQDDATRHAAGDHYPSSAGVEKIITALRSLLRIESDEADSIVVSSYSCTSWILAFIEWCMGLPPNIRDSTERTIHAQPESSVGVLIPPVSSELRSINIELFTASKSLRNTFAVEASRMQNDERSGYQGMVTIETHGQQTLQQLQCVSGLGMRAILEALPVALKECQTQLNPLITFPGVLTPRNYTDNEIAGQSHPPELLNADRILGVLHRYLWTKETKLEQLQNKPNGTRGKRSRMLSKKHHFLTYFAIVADLPILKQWARDSESACTRCKLARASFEDQDRSPQNHLEKHIIDRLALVCENVLALSLLDGDLEDVRLYFDKRIQFQSPTTSDSGELLAVMQQILKGEAIQHESISVDALINHLRKLLAHETRHLWLDGYWVASSNRGQVLFPKSFESTRLEQSPRLTLKVVPGILNRADRPHWVRFRAIAIRKRTGPEDESCAVPSE
ncbi:MAG: hypothetical protein Q9227_000721 [Pyrenula ochraceoflavens]